MDSEEKENPDEKIDGNEETDLQIEDTEGGETNFQTQPQNVDYTTKPKLFSTTDFGPYFTRGCKWSPDGLCILVCSDDHNLRIFDLPSNDKLEETKDQSDKLAKVSFSSCQQNLIKTFQIEAMIALITKMVLIFS